MFIHTHTHTHTLYIYIYIYNVDASKQIHGKVDKISRFSSCPCEDSLKYALRKY